MFMMHKATPPFWISKYNFNNGNGEFLTHPHCGFFCFTLFKTTLPLLLIYDNKTESMFFVGIIKDRILNILNNIFTWFWLLGLLDIWTFGYLDLWTFGHLNLWTFGPIGIWTCIHLDLYEFGPVYIWIFRQLDLYTFGTLEIWTFRHLDL